MGLLLLYYPLVIWQLSLFNIDMNTWWFTVLEHDDFPVGSQWKHQRLKGKALTCGSEKCSLVAQTVCSHHVLQGGCDNVLCATLWQLLMHLHTGMMPRYQIISTGSGLGGVGCDNVLWLLRTDCINKKKWPHQSHTSHIPVTLAFSSSSNMSMSFLAL